MANISNHNHKDRGYDRVTFAAPININNEGCIMAAMVRKTKGNRFDVNRVLTPDGEKLAIKTKDAERSISGGFTARTGEVAPASRSTSKDSISDS